LTAYITTVDNPYSPATQFDQWLREDMRLGYNSCAYLDRIAKTNDAMSKQEYRAEINRAIDEIVLYNPELYRKVVV